MNIKQKFGTLFKRSVFLKIDKPAVFRMIIYLFIGIILILIYIRYLERQGVYFPQKEFYIEPSLSNLKYEDVYIFTKDNLRLHAWFIAYPEARYTILFFHGNAGNIADRLDKIELLRQAKVNVFIIDYRGYGKSEGRPEEKGLYLDAQAAYDYLMREKHLLPKDIILYGESLGSAVAVDLAAQVEVGGLILEGAFSSGRDMAKKIYPFLPSFLVSNLFDNVTKIQKIKAPKLFLHSPQDEIVPFTLAQKLFSTAEAPKKFIELSGDHNGAFLNSSEKYVSAIVAFLKSLENTTP